MADHVQSLDKVVAIFCDNRTAVLYLVKAGDTRSELLSRATQSRSLVFPSLGEGKVSGFATQVIVGMLNVVTDILSRSH